MASNVLLVQVDVAGLDGELAPGGHRVARVDDEIDDDLLDVGGISLDVPHRLRQHQSQLDVLADGALEHVVQAQQ